MSRAGRADKAPTVRPASGGAVPTRMRSHGDCPVVRTTPGHRQGCHIESAGGMPVQCRLVVVAAASSSFAMSCSRGLTPSPVSVD